jgi:cytochrome c553
MRCLLMITAAAALCACGQRDNEGTAVAPTAAAISFDGAGAKGQAQVAHGERISRVLGCHGCHGDDLEGQQWDNDPKGYGLLWTSNLTRAIPGMSDAQLEELLRKGLHPTREHLWAMPSQIFQHMSDADLAALIAYLRTLKPAGEVHPAPVLGPKAIAQWKSGEVPPAADLVRKAEFRMPPDLGAATAQGRYIISMTCTECHGGQLKGTADDEHKVPDLIVAGAYSRDEFNELTTKGVAKDHRKIDELMSIVGKSRFSHLTEGERAAVYAYLKARAEQPQ